MAGFWQLVCIFNGTIHVHNHVLMCKLKYVQIEYSGNEEAMEVEEEKFLEVDHAGAEEDIHVGETEVDSELSKFYVFVCGAPAKGFCLSHYVKYACLTPIRIVYERM